MSVGAVVIQHPWSTQPIIGAQHDAWMAEWRWLESRYATVGCATYDMCETWEQHEDHLRRVKAFSVVR